VTYPSDGGPRSVWPRLARAAALGLGLWPRLARAAALGLGLWPRLARCWPGLPLWGWGSGPGWPGAGPVLARAAALGWGSGPGWPGAGPVLARAAALGWGSGPGWPGLPLWAGALGPRQRKAPQPGGWGALGRSGAGSGLGQKRGGEN